MHEDAFGLADDVAAGKSSREVLFCGGAGQGDRGVLGEDLPGGDRVVGEGTRRGAVQVESTEAFRDDEETKRQHAGRGGPGCRLPRSPPYLDRRRPASDLEPARGVTVGVQAELR